MDICTTPPPNIAEQLMEEPLAKKLRQKDSKRKEFRCARARKDSFFYF